MEHGSGDLEGWHQATVPKMPGKDLPEPCCSMWTCVGELGGIYNAGHAGLVASMMTLFPNMYMF